MKASICKLSFLSCMVAIITFGCKTEVVQPALNYTGVWNASYTMNSSSFSNNYEVYHWSSKLTINSDGTAQAIHQPGNPIFPDTTVTENFKWGIINAQTMYLNSLNWSVTASMQYRVLQYGNNYISMDGFDDDYQYWQLVLRK